jgi:CxxC motif-containing protein (DUF1111 family)
MLQRIMLSLSGLIASLGLIAQTINIAGGNGQRAGHPPAIGSIKKPRTPTSYGDPLPGLTAAEATRFSLGLAQFDSAETPAEGLGPIFNAQKCSVCHTQPLKVSGDPAIGGASAVTETRFGASFVNNTFNPLPNEGNTLLHQMAINVATQEVIPQDATIVAHRKTTPLFGAGLIDAIPDAAIIANSQVPKGDGIKGTGAILSDAVTNLIGTNKVGRFGWKNQQATVLAFSADAYLNEMGISNRFFPNDFAPDGDTARLNAAEASVGLSATVAQDQPADPTKPEDPITNPDDTDRFADFMTFLAPPPTVPLTTQSLAGQDIFRAINCTGCHTPSYTTGPSKTSPALAFKNVALYSDLLLHDVGTGDGIGQAAAAPNQLRTAPLWGLRARAPFLHDGRAYTVEQAIEYHGGEATIVRNRYLALPQAAKDAVLAFLNSI